MKHKLLFLKKNLRYILDICLIALTIKILTTFHYTHLSANINFHILLQFGYYFPIIYAAGRYGLAGGAGTSLLITALFLPYLLQFRQLDQASLYTQIIEILIINGVGWLTGYLYRQERIASGKYIEAFRIQEELYEKLTREGAERERLEREIRQTERLSALGRLSSGLAHEIRNPLGIIQATVQLLAHERADDRELAEYCQVLQQECVRLNRMLTQFLEFARPKEPKRQTISLLALIQDALNLVEPYFHRNKIRLEKKLETLKTILVQVDPDQIKQVILNVLLNAAEAQEKGGIITLEGFVGNRHTGLIVKDEGPGLDEEIMPYIFDPFFTTKDKGTGLGLSVTHRIMEQHQGRIFLANREQGGVETKIMLLNHNSNKSEIPPDD